MPPTTRAKRRLAYKRLLDKRDKLRKEEQRLCEQQSKLVPAVETHKTELNTVTAQHEHDISRLESIKTFFESRYGQYDELVRLQQENAEDVNQVQGVHGMLSKATSCRRFSDKLKRSSFLSDLTTPLHLKPSSKISSTKMVVRLMHRPPTIRPPMTTTTRTMMNMA